MNQGKATGQITIRSELHGDMLKLTSDVNGVKMQTVYFALDEYAAEHAKKELGKPEPKGKLN